MKALHTMKFVNDATIELTKYEARLSSSDNYEEAKNIACNMLGYIDCLTTFLKAMICTENNDFTAEYSDVIDDWTNRVRRLLVDKAVKTEQDPDTVLELIPECNVEN